MAACTSSRSLWSPCSSSSPFQSSWAAWNTWWLYWWQPCLGFLFVCFCLHSVLLTKMHFHGHASSICRAVVCIYLFIFGCIAGIPRTVCWNVCHVSSMHAWTSFLDLQLIEYPPPCLHLELVTSGRTSETPYSNLDPKPIITNSAPLMAFLPPNPDQTPNKDLSIPPLPDLIVVLGKRNWTRFSFLFFFVCDYARLHLSIINPLLVLSVSCHISHHRHVFV